MDPHMMAFVERTFGAPLVVVHEAAHAVAAHLLGLHVSSVTVNRDQGAGALLRFRDRDPEDVRKMAVAAAVPACVYRQIGLPAVPGCSDDIDFTKVYADDFERRTGRRCSPWAAARALILTPEFAAGMARLIAPLAARGSLSGEEVAGLLADVKPNPPPPPDPPAPTDPQPFAILPPTVCEAHEYFGAWCVEPMAFEAMMSELGARPVAR